MNKNNSFDNPLVLSHSNQRAFQPHRLHPPRDFDSSQWSWVAESECPVVLEIGAGKGKYALLFAKQNPQVTLIAIERTVTKFQAFDKLAQQAQLTNLYHVHADAIPWTVFALPPKSIQQVFVLYPNPEPNNANQQWLNMPYFEFLLSRLQDGATITLASNIREYIDNAQHQAMDVWHLPTLRQQVSIDSQRTHFEIKYLARGEVCEQLIMTKPDGYQTRFDLFVKD